MLRRYEVDEDEHHAEPRLPDAGLGYELVTDSVGAAQGAGVQGPANNGSQNTPKLRTRVSPRSPAVAGTAFAGTGGPEPAVAPMP